MKYIRIITALIVSLSFTACGSDDDILIEEVTGRVVEGTIANGFENCEWLVEINGQNFVPNVLSIQFRVDGLMVLMKVEFLNESTNCGTQTISPERLRIEQIRLSQ